MKKKTDMLPNIIRLHAPWMRIWNCLIQTLLRLEQRHTTWFLTALSWAGGSIRIHRRDIQQKIFGLLGFSQEDAQERFGFLLDAFKYGVPPHGGLAFGFDRIIMLMTGATSIRDVIAFPKVKDASCPLTNAPDVVDAKQLDELGITVKEEEVTEE